MGGGIADNVDVDATGLFIVGGCCGGDGGRWAGAGGRPLGTDRVKDGVNGNIGEISSIECFKLESVSSLISGKANTKFWLCEPWGKAGE